MAVDAQRIDYRYYRIVNPPPSDLELKSRGQYNRLKPGDVFGIGLMLARESVVEVRKTFQHVKQRIVDKGLGPEL